MNSNQFEHKAKDHWEDLKRKFKALKNYPLVWQKRDIELFFEVEAILYLHETLCPSVEGHSPQDSWALVSGYCIEGINDQPFQRRQCLLLRNRLRYARTLSVWRWWLKWYMEQPASLRLYDFIHTTDDDWQFRQKTYDVILKDERLQVYTALFSEKAESSDAQEKDKATPGRYTFDVDGMVSEVEIPEAFLTFADIPTPTRTVPTRRERQPLVIRFSELLETAQELDVLECELHIKNPNNWHKRLSDIRLTIFAQDGVLNEQSDLTIDGLFHLVGALGVGKSALIGVLTYYLAHHKNLHITVVMNTVVEAVQFAAWLRRLDIKAAPALGRNRANHENKVGLANTQTLSIAQVFQPHTVHEPILDWMPSPCALSGGQAVSIPIGKEPCLRLKGEDEAVYSCPLISVCPVHQLTRDLVESQVWVVNPMSFLYSSAAEGLGEGKMRLLEAVYRFSDLVIIDEADRVQVQWDRAFAPTYPIVGSEDAMLDALRRELNQVSIGQGRRHAARASFNLLMDMNNQVDTLANRIFSLMVRQPELARWIQNYQITSVGLFTRLTNELVKTVSKSRSPEELTQLKDELRKEFREYWSNPLRRETGALADWINDLLGSDTPPTDRRKRLRRWLAGKMGWQKALTQTEKGFIYKLDFCLTMAAMLKLTNDIFHRLNWIEDEIGRLGVSDYDLHDHITNLVPDPPFGVVLGVRHVNYSLGDLGILNAIRYRGVGRWLLLNFPQLYQDQTGLVGPHLLVTSGTSWLPSASQFHLDAPPHALLLPVENKPVGKINVRFKPVGSGDKRIAVSGAGKQRTLYLQQIVHELAKASPTTPSDLQKELDYWQARGERRCVLLVVNSYEQTSLVLDVFNQYPQWDGRVKQLLPDDEELLNSDSIRVREAERFREHNADILIAPLMSIQRGFNILDEADNALLGSVFFLVRPYPPPDDISTQILSLNAWLLKQLRDGRVLNPNFSQFGIKGMAELRQHAVREWRRRLKTGNRGLTKMDGDLYAEFLRNQFVSIWQTIGRLLRGGRDARVFFVDSAFGPEAGRRHMLFDWYIMLKSLLNSHSERDKQLATHLYQPIASAFENAVNDKEIF